MKFFSSLQWVNSSFSLNATSKQNDSKCTSAEETSHCPAINIPNFAQFRRDWIFQRGLDANSIRGTTEKWTQWTIDTIHPTLDCGRKPSHAQEEHANSTQTDPQPGSELQLICFVCITTQPDIFKVPIYRDWSCTLWELTFLTEKGHKHSTKPVGCEENSAIRL